MCNFSIERERILGEGIQKHLGVVALERETDISTVLKCQGLNVTCICLIYINNYIYHIIIKTL